LTTEDPLPFLVIGGYLGSGKTTLVNRLLRGGEFGRVAVLVNDFGEINIDTDLIESHDGDTISLANGCICCSFADGFSSALAKVGEQAESLDVVVVEVSGVGDPWKVAQWGRTPGFSLDAVVTLVDAETVLERSHDQLVGGTVCGQVRNADLVVVTKTDLVDEIHLLQVQEWLGQVCEARVVVGAASLAPLLMTGLAAGSTASDTIPHSPHADHVAAYRAFEKPITRKVLDDLLASRSREVMRVKGHVAIADAGGRTAMVQVVGKRVEVTMVGDSDGVALGLVAVATPGILLRELEIWLGV